MPIELDQFTLIIETELIAIDYDLRLKPDWREFLCTQFKGLSDLWLNIR